ncbi:NAD-dependent epimerase/dehydratase family protein [Pseudobutyrivibrio ruminis]|uniref:Nucleoside-diphosphate sugar epimerase n=1 Tax=Pseudobutyrivibrio ruminis TaxID=46206 RepID=A0A2G3DTR8_9FIRM|nr:NAD(P)-dependent oxidoreductase [Pseudobutyrivibrio ruminis]PHU34374.1 nucleoside-diphosphate sugar epimerase [Pseudobutyrivibrio ruminis]
MKILVTGANGYLGQGIVKHILDNGNQVVAADFTIDNVDERADRRACNLFEIDNPYEFFGKPDVLLHLAWRDGFVHYSDAHIEDLPKHYEFIKTFAESNVKKLAVMGSMHEIGFFEGSINEDTPCNPTTPYGIAKNALRQLTEMLCKQKEKEYMWLRGYYIVGNSQYGSSIFSKITAAVREGKKEFPFTMGQNQFDFVDYEVFCEQVARAVGQDKILGVINISSGQPEKLADRVERFIKENDYDINLKYGAFPDRPYDSKAVWGDGKKIQSIMSICE